jgi:adenylate cyclase
MLGTCYRATGNAQAALHVAEVTLARAEKRLAQDQNDVQALTYGAGALAQLRQVQRAQEWMDRALVADPDNFSMRYNFACALALDPRTTDAALDMLEPLLGTMDQGTLRWAKVDPDLDPLRAHPRFKALVAASEARLAAVGDGGQGA